MQADNFYKIRDIKKGKDVSYFSYGYPVYCVGTSLRTSGAVFETELEAILFLENAVVEAVLADAAIDSGDYEIVGYCTTKESSIKSDYVLEKFIAGEDSKYATHRDRALAALFNKAVKQGFHVIGEPYRKLFFGEGKYRAIAKENVPSPMIANWQDYVEDGLEGLTADELSGILMLSTDTIAELYGLEDRIDVAIALEK